MRGGSNTSNSGGALSLSSIALTGVTIKKLNDFHYKISVSANENERREVSLDGQEY